MADELNWVVPAIVLTLGLAAFTLAEIPDYAGIVPALLLLPLWLLATVALLGCAVIVPTLRMMRSGEERPIARWLAYARARWRFLLFSLFAITLAGVNMITFMWIKPLLNYLVPFRADPMLASIDHMVFRTDPWRLLGWLNDYPLALFYHRGWFTLMIVTLLTVLLKPASREKSAVLLTYFLLWSLFGPIGHVLMPAAGPVFYSRLGYGGTFNALVMEGETRKLADYLWAVYSARSFGPAAGISAMPSLHIATTAWMVIAVRQFAPRWLLPMAAAGLLIFLLSISLGWHYAIDGVAGSVGAFAMWKLSQWVFSRSPPLHARMLSA
jgi:PAP2 superfamily protein